MLFRRDLLFWTQVLYQQPRQTACKRVVLPHRVTSRVEHNLRQRLVEILGQSVENP